MQFAHSRYGVQFGGHPERLLSSATLETGNVMSDRPVSVSTGNVPYTVTIHDGQRRWLGDAQPVNGGADAGPDPQSQVLGALGACTAITVSIVAARKQWPLTGVHVHLYYTQRGAGGTEISREIVLDGALDDGRRARLMEVADKCPIHRLLTGEVGIATRLQIEVAATPGAVTP